MKTITFDETMWQLVPKEPTQKMLNSAWDNMVYRTEMLASYQAMLSAAPEHPEAEPLTDEEIDACRRSGLIDSLLDPYDALENGGEISSMYADLREFARAIESRIQEGK